jgi:protein-S-isoprenylcysteine O-methyltransferase Ste14
MMDELFVRRAIVLVCAAGYWGGVWLQARRVRKRIGRSPNLSPRGGKERLLWLGWFMVVVGWMALPILARLQAGPIWLRVWPEVVTGAGLAGGVILALAGYAGTLWSYQAMGDRWRIGVDRAQRGPLVVIGPYGYVRHPIYLFQIVMLVSGLVLIPTLLAVAVLLLHTGCALVKAWDEEAHLLRSYGEVYGEYAARTGMLFPPIWRRTSPRSEGKWSNRDANERE